MIKIEFSGDVAAVFAEIIAVGAKMAAQMATAASPVTSADVRASEPSEIETRASEAPVAKPKKTRKAKAPEPEPEEAEDGEEQENGTDGEQEREEPDHESDDDGGKTVAAKTNGKATAESLKLKEETIAKLKKAHASGKAAAVRGILTKYGGGAKSFNEIDPPVFKAIAKAINAGALE